MEKFSRLKWLFSVELIGQSFVETLMLAEKIQPMPATAEKHHITFFRQSGWLMIANIVGGLMTLGVHPLNKHIPDSEYTAFGVLLLMVSCLPTMPLQMVFAQQSALALATGRERQLAGMILLLASLWVPMFSGVLQGRQDFFWQGWTAIIGGVGRLAAAAFIVLVLAGGAAGMIMGTLIGVGLSAIISIWKTRDLWALPAEPFDRKNLMRQVMPLMFGFGACQFLFTSDTMFVKAWFSPDAMKPYIAAGTLSRGLLWLVLPLAAVMFPKIVHSSAKREKNNLFGLVVLGTAVLGVCGIIGLWLAGPLLVKIVYKSNDIAGTMALIPWYAGAMVPLALANVMVNDLLARSRFGVVPFMALLAIAYGFTLPWMLDHFPGRLEIPLQTLGVFNLLLFGICAWFSFGTPKSKT